MENTNEPSSFDIVQSSLFRSVHSSLPDYIDKLPHVTSQMKSRCTEHITGHTLLIRESSSQYYEALTETLEAHRAVLFYIAPNFDVYGSYGNDQLKQELKNINLRFGANVAEGNIGTNAAALSAYSPTAIWTIGEQNYARCLHPYALYAFTVYGRYDRSAHVLLVVRKEHLNDAVRSLFALIQATESATSGGKLTEDNLAKDLLLSRSLGTNETESFLVITNKDNRIVFANDVFYRLFSTDYDSVIFHPLESVAPSLSTPQRFSESVEEYSDILLLDFGPYGRAKYLVNFVRQPEGGMIIKARRLLQTSEPKAFAGRGGAGYSFDDLIGQSKAFSQAKSFAFNVASTDGTILIRGESGTGKELFAQAIHNASKRRNEPFVALNCAAIPRDLIESELFGYEGGTFTGADKKGRKGKFELADKGTLFLDEIAEMPVEMQGVLLRVLEERCITRVGGASPVPVDVRIISATNQNLEQYIQDARFRLDLYYRLNVITLDIPPLRERRGDLGLLADHFLAHYAQKYGKSVGGIALEAREAIFAHDWRGNVRELRNAIERAVILGEDDFLKLGDLPPGVAESYRGQKAVPDAPRALSETPAPVPSDRQLQHDRALELMRRFDGNKSKVAKEMGIARSTLYQLLRETEGR